jgi:hypothetical protein
VALAPELAAQLPAGELFPAGATITMDSTSWHEQDGNTNAMGTVTVAGQPAQHVEIGFVRQQPGAWPVTLEEAVP